MKGKVWLFFSLKWLCVALVAVFLCSLLFRGGTSSTPFETMHTAVTEAADMTYMQKADDQMIRRLYGLDPESYEGIALYYPTTNMQAQELLLVKLTDPAQQQAVTDAVEARLATQMASFDGYGIQQYAMLENALVEVRGNYLLLIVAEDPGAVAEAFAGTL